MSERYRVAVDVGGTFTDLVAVDARGKFNFAKVQTTSPDYQRGVIAAVDAAGIPFEAIDLFLHGNTLATNAIIARAGAKTGLIGTKGFRDLIEIRRANRSREGMYDPSWDPTPPLVPRRNRLTVAERVDYLGRVQTPLCEEEGRSIARAFRKRGIESVAVSFLNSFLNADSELQMAQILQEECPGLYVTLSSELAPVILEFERTSTAVVNAYVEPIQRRYMDSLIAAFRARGYGGEILIMQSSGGVITPEGAGRNAARTIMSGPAAGTNAAKAFGDLVKTRHLISFDMGGTSADIATIYNGQIRTNEGSNIEFGMPVILPSIDIISIGAGGGTIAWIDDAGVLKSGPRSAGSAPGPACYGAGGTEATNTDANVVLGVLNPEQFVGGAIRLGPELARQAVQRLADRLGLDLIRTAAGIIRVSNANMVQAIRQVTTERGFDPREFALFAFGGAGPLHGADVAAQMGIPKVVVPPNPGLTSALGLLFSDLRYDFSKTYIKRVDQLDCAAIEKEFTTLEQRAQSALKAAGFDAGRIRTQRIGSFKYYGGFEAVPLGIELEGPVFDDQTLARALSKFAAEHEREYKYVLEEVPIELELIRVVALGIIETPELERRPAAKKGSSAQIGVRNVYFDSKQDFQSTAVLDRRKLAPGSRIPGPAVVEQMDSTVLIGPGMHADVDEYSNIIITVKGA